MVHSIELLLGEQTETAIREQWRLLAEAGLPSEYRPNAGTQRRPHITLIACAQITPATATALSPLLTAALPLPTVIGAPMIFGTAKRARPTLLLVRQLLPSNELLQLQRAVVDDCPPAVDDHFAAGHWAPHITLGRRFRPEQIGPALQALGSSLAAEDATGGRNAVLAGCRYWRGDQKLTEELV